MRSLTLEATLERAVAEHHPRLVTLCSFQKEESVILDALLRIAPDARVATIDTGVLFPDTLATWRAFEERYGVEIEVHDAVGNWTGPENCCSAAKVAALESALSDVDAWVTGLRREQGPTRANTEHVEWDEQRSIWKFNPLAEWTEKDLWQRISERDLPYSPLHDQGYESIGCAPCTLPGNGRDGRWAGDDKTECGLHVVPAETTGTSVA